MLTKLAQTRREKIFLTLCALLALISLLQLWNHFKLQDQIEAANDQIAYFSELSNRSLAGNATQAAECLRSIVTHFPSGTKQTHGSALDTLVEHQRERAQLEIIAILRVRTRDDLGQKPEPWIKKYGKPQPRAF
ncbi:MAG TPA: hypothetical protein VGH19_12005 [Verrucomicrobiae bacterium]